MTPELYPVLDPADYDVLHPVDQEALCQEITDEIVKGMFKPAGKPSREHWRQMWSRNNSIIPYYVKPAQVLRVNQQFVRPRDPWLELRWYQQFQKNLLMKYFSDVPAIYEFGCGNGWNLAAARTLYPQKKLMGLDWAKTAVERLPSDTRGQVFDFFRPDYDLNLAPGSGILTVGALEQTGTDWKDFLVYLLVQRPAICVHVEPIVEWYHPNNKVDQTAIQYHLARNYWQGFPANLASLSKLGMVKIEILEQKRSYFGSKYLEGYSVFAWRPT